MAANALSHAIDNVVDALDCNAGAFLETTTSGVAIASVCARAENEHASNIPKSRKLAFRYDERAPVGPRDGVGMSASPDFLVWCTTSSPLLKLRDVQTKQTTTAQVTAQEERNLHMC
ncbi:hypothetical protein [Diaphorobacter aerolatus]|uniref:hypothetical protein n=1 Tax=Diaphorobacter aerolatus TaxID=1288495 RepID=UPI00384A6C2D